MQRKKGISLIVLVITIIVMIILAAAIILSLNNNNIIGKSKAAVDKTNKKQVQELAQTLWADAYIDGKRGEELVESVEKALAEQDIIASDYGIIITDTGVTFEESANQDETPAVDEWEFAYTYASSTQEWESKILRTDGVTPTGDIVVKFYKTGQTTEPASIKYNDTTFTFETGDAYKMLIQGNGNMSALMITDENSNPTTGYAWQTDTLAYLSGDTSIACVMPYVTEVIIGEGVTNIGAYAFGWATSLTKVQIANSVKNIEENVFIADSNLTTVNVDSKEEWDNVIIERLNYELLDVSVEYTYRTKVERLANEGWIKAKKDGKTTQTEYQSAVTSYLAAKGVSNETLALYNIGVTTTGVEVTGKETTLGSLILSATDYGKTVNYTANGVSDWKVLYKQTVDEIAYVYLIASENIPVTAIPKNIPGTQVSTLGVTLTTKSIYWKTPPSSVASGTIDNDHWLAEWSNYSSSANARCATYLLDEQYWQLFKNTEIYESNVVGVAGAATAEMVVKSYNERSIAIGDTENTELALTIGNYGYGINQKFSRLDKLYTPSYKEQDYTWLASPENTSTHILMTLAYSAQITRAHIGANTVSLGLRPVISLKSSTPASIGVTADATDIVLK